MRGKNGVSIKLCMCNAGNGFRKTFYETRLHPLAADITVCEVRGRESEMIINSPRAIWRGKRWWMIDFFRLSVRAWLKRGFFFRSRFTRENAVGALNSLFFVTQWQEGQKRWYLCTTIWENRSPSSTKRKGFCWHSKSHSSLSISVDQKKQQRQEGKKFFCCHQPPSVCHATNSTKKCQKEKKFDMPEKRWKKTERQRRNILLHKNSPLLESRIFSALRRQRQWTEIT